MTKTSVQQLKTHELRPGMFFVSRALSQHACFIVSVVPSDIDHHMAVDLLWIQGDRITDLHWLLSAMSVQFTTKDWIFLHARDSDQ